MIKRSLLIYLFLFINRLFAQNGTAINPVIYADVPDMSMIRVGDTYYMSSTTMHLSPGLPIMKSKDLINWELLNYAYDTLASNDALNLENGSNAYGRGSWASCLRYHNGIYYVSTFSATSGKTHIFRTKDIEKGNWKENAFTPSYHDHTIFFDDDGKVYMIYGAGKLKILELKADLTGIMPGSQEKVLIENASAPAGDKIMLGAEGSQLFKIKGRYYLFNITWPRGGMRTVVIHRADNINGPWEGKIGLQDLGVAQGGLIDSPDGKWYAYLFRDNGGVGRIPYLVPVKWEDGWPVLGEAEKVPMTLDLPANKSLISGLVHSDEFIRKKKDKALPLVWQWNHNPDNALWSLNERKGFLRLKTGRIDSSFVSARNTLTQRTIGPECTGTTMLDVSALKNGDFAGLALLQKNFGQVGVKMLDGKKVLSMVTVVENASKEIETIPLNQNTVYLRAVCDFKDRKDLAHFDYSLDGKSWKSIGTEFKMLYTLPHFMGYRFGLFNYATQNIGGHADFDFFNIENLMASPRPGLKNSLGSKMDTLKNFIYTNPLTRDTAISMRDHFIIKADNKWYCTGTSNPVWTGLNPGVRLLVSDDLIHWKQHSFLIDASKLPPNCPYNGRFWAPEIHLIKNKYYLTVNSGQVTEADPKGMSTHSVWLFTSDKVTGPYSLLNGPLTPQYNNDATLYEDDDGETYFYCSGGGLFQAKIELKTGKLTTPLEKFLDKKQPGWPEWMVGGIEGPFVTKRDNMYFMFFSAWTRGYEVALLKSKTPLGPWELVSQEPIFGTRKKGYRQEMAKGGGYDSLKFQDTEDPYQETGHNALFEGPDGKLWSSCHYFMYEKRPYPYSQTFESWELTPQMGIEPVTYKDGRFYIQSPTWTEQLVEIESTKNSKIK